MTPEMLEILRWMDERNGQLCGWWDGETVNKVAAPDVILALRDAGMIAHMGPGYVVWRLTRAGRALLFQERAA